jgi:hypothetical protein
MFFAIVMVTQSLLAGIGAGLVWGVVIFILDSYIIASYKKMDSKWKEFLIVLPRLVLALILGFTISVPMELKVFSNEITEEVKLIRQEKESLNQSTANEIYQKQIAPVNEQKKILEQSLATIMKPIESLDVFIKEKKDLLVNERAGKGPSGKKGNGLIVAAMEKDLTDYENQKNELLRNSSENIDKYRKSIAEQDSIIAATIKPNPEKIGALYGMAVQLSALERLKDKNSDVAAAYWLLVLLILGIETAPVFVKFFTPKGKYDNILLTDDYLVWLEQEKRKSDRHQEINADIVSYNAMNDIRNERQNKVNGHIMDEIAAAQGEIATAAITAWKENQLREVNMNLAAFISTNGV